MDAREIRRSRADARAQRTAERTAAGRDAPWRRRWRMFRRRVGNLALEFGAARLIRLVAATWRVRYVGREHHQQLSARGAFVFALWHGDMLAPAPLLRGQDLAVLVSPSDDGGLVVQVLTRFGYRIVRGSTTRQAPRAMRELRAALEAGIPVVLTPDGPRGPRHTINVGVAWLARETGTPILPLTVRAVPAWRLRSWDAFTIPKPFARVEITYHEPIHVPADVDDLGLEAISERLRETMLVGSD